MIEQGYPWSENFQLRLLALYLKAPKRTIGVIEPQFFTSPVLIDIARVMKEEYSRNPKAEIRFSKTTLKELVKAGLGKKARENWSLYRKQISRLYKTKLKDLDTLHGQAMEFAKESKYRESLVEAEKFVNAKKYERVQEIMEEARNFGKDYSLGIDFWNKVTDRDRWENTRTNVIPTGFRKLDRWIGGGVGAGELAIILGKGKGGKTTVLANIAAHATMKHKNVAIASGEVSAANYRKRIDGIITGLPLNKLLSLRKKVRQILLRAKKDARSSLWIKQFPSGKATVGDIEQWLDMLEREGIDIDILLVDYIALFKPNESFKDRRLNIGQVATELRGIGVERQIPVVSASQANRAALEKDTLSPIDFAEDISQFWTLDYMIALCQSKWEQGLDKHGKKIDNDKPEKGRLMLAAARDSPAGMSSKILLDRASQRIIETDFEQPKKESLESDPLLRDKHHHHHRSHHGKD